MDLHARALLSNYKTDCAKLDMEITDYYGPQIGFFFSGMSESQRTKRNVIRQKKIKGNKQYNIIFERFLTKSPIDGAIRHKYKTRIILLY